MILDRLSALSEVYVLSIKLTCEDTSDANNLGRKFTKKGNCQTVKLSGDYWWVNPTQFRLWAKNTPPTMEVTFSEKEE